MASSARWPLSFLYFFLIITLPGYTQSTRSQEMSWKQIVENGGGTITIYWYESKPFIYRTTTGIAGIEYDIIQGFQKFLKTQYKVDVEIIWKEASDFADTYNQIKKRTTEGVIGASAFSITPERMKEVSFTNPYMSDISVLITSKNIPILKSFEELSNIFPKLTAVTIAGTTYEQDIIRLKEQGNLPFNIEYIHSSANILHAVAEKDSAFGFIDLPVYMMIFNQDPSVNVKRQNLFPVKRKGFALIYPQESDWQLPLSSYFSSQEYDASLANIIGRYIDRELYHFIESLAIQPNDIVALLTKEKEIQHNNLLEKTEQIQKEAQTRNVLVGLIVAVLIFSGVIILLYQMQHEQKRKIERQQADIESQNQQLEKRNQHLITLDEEKNNLIRILAHDLRTPINHIQGFTHLLQMSNGALEEDQKMIVERISDASVRLNKMITNILDIDSIENNRTNMFLENVALDPLIRQVVRSFEKQAAKKDILLSMTSGVQQGQVRGDSLFLTQVFENLLSNAIKFSEKGKRVDVALSESETSVVVSVKDAGPGLTEDDLKKLFKKFQRLSARPTDGEASTGLGLSIVKKYVEVMNGQVWCESKAGEGANFMVEFPKASVMA